MTAEKASTPPQRREHVSDLPVLFLTHYARIGAPSRYRYYQYFPRLEVAGIRPTVDFIQSDEMCMHKQRGERMLWFTVQTLIAYLRRMTLLVVQGRRFPVWVIEKEVFPYLPWWVERLFLSRKARIVVDYDDAVFLKYDGDVGWIPRIYGGKIARLMARSDVVFAGNEFIAEYARRAGARDIRWIPSVVDEARYAGPPREASTPVVGWMGAYRNSHHITTVAGALRRLAAERRFVLRIIGGRRIELPPGLEVEYREWSEEREIDELKEFTVGIMPLVDGAWEKGKCGLKLIQYLAAGVPVVATPIGINRQIVQAGLNGFLASTEEEWFQALRTLLVERARGGYTHETCRRSVEGTYTLAAVSPLVVSVLNGLGRGDPR